MRALSSTAVDVAPVLPLPPRSLDPRWIPTLARQKRQRVWAGLALLILLGVGVRVSVFRPNQHLSVSDRVVLLVICLGCTLGVMGLIAFEHRRRVWLFQHGEERLGTIVKDRRLLLMRELWIVMPRDDSIMMAPFSCLLRDADFDEFDLKGQRLIRIVVDPRKPRRWHPIPGVRSTLRSAS